MIKVNVGDTLRSYDFKPMVGRDDCFVEGTVIKMGLLKCGYDAYLIKVTKDSWEDGRVGKEVYVPMEVSFMDFAGRVMNLSRI